ncbi:ATP-grasp domain-containing protein [Actinoalloteichus hoggarensis]|nr:ATP-grasp domain-containing protein [Actinoalloteichus hoggarensis]
MLNIFVIGLDEENHDVLRAVPSAERYRFHPLLCIEELQHGEIPVADLLARAERVLTEFDGSIDAIVGFWDFPVSTMVPILARRFGTRGADLTSVLKCEHKYWSRLEQQKVIDEHPRFALVSPSDDRPPAELRYPMWLKPVKSFSSELAFKVDDDAEFRQAVERIGRGIGRVGEPFEHILAQVSLPPEIAAVGGRAILAEEALRGVQVAVEGYGCGGDVVIYGTLDSVDYPDSSCFLRHQYPSQLPDSVQRRLADISTRVMRHIGLDNATFSIEYFYDPDTDEIGLLEINSRHSQSHAVLFDHVDGAPNHHCMLALALGEDPRLPRGLGEYGIAAKWYHRRFADGVLRRGPTREELDRVEQEIPGVVVRPTAVEGARLSEQVGQDSYSFTLAEIVVGARDEAELVDKYERCVAALTFEFDEAAQVAEVQETITGCETGLIRETAQEQEGVER